MTRIVRVAIWAGVGLLVSVAWGWYFANAAKALPIPSAMMFLASWTQPAVGLALYLRPSLGLGLSTVAVANAATYALVGALAVALRRR